MGLEPMTSRATTLSTVAGDPITVLGCRGRTSRGWIREPGASLESLFLRGEQDHKDAFVLHLLGEPRKIVP